MEGLGGGDSLPSRIASLVHTHFDGLPNRSKPVVRDDGTEEWIPMTGIVIVKGENTPAEKLTCIAVTTGAKCLSASQIPQCKGLVLHDWHAEILAMRAFNYWLLSECHSILADTTEIEPSAYIRRRHPMDHHLPPFEFYPDIAIYMYCTCAPCGDASMELCMAAQDDPTPWTFTTPANDPVLPSQNHDNNNHVEEPTAAATFLDGRAHFSRLGIVRRKPARADAESTKSKSCSDKIALRQVSSLLNHETSLLVVPTKNAYLAGIVLPEEEISRAGCARCFGPEGRMKDLGGQRWSVSSPLSSTTRETDEMGSGFGFHPFQTLSIPNEQLRALWPFRKPRAGEDDIRPETDTQEGKRQDGPRKKSKPGTISAVWVRGPSAVHSGSCSVLADNGSRTLPMLRGSRTGLFENIINGVRQGHRASSPGVKGASALSRAKMWRSLTEVVRCSCSEQDKDKVHKKSGFSGSTELAEGQLGRVQQVTQASTYNKFKEASLESMVCIQARKLAIQEARDVLSGWVPNTGDEAWGLEVLIDTKKRKR